ncbi:MAG: hypothetical protein EZS28_028534, partial [Streblomastix strix]
MRRIKLVSASQRFRRKYLLESGVVTPHNYRVAVECVNKRRELHQIGRTPIIGSDGKKQLDQWVSQKILYEKSTSIAEIEQVAKEIIGQEKESNTPIRLSDGWGVHYVERSPGIHMIKKHIVDS